MEDRKELSEILLGNNKPRDFNILIVPYEVYAKERGASWARHM